MHQALKPGSTRRFARRAEAIPAAREFVRGWLSARRGGQPVENLVLAASEAMNNVIDHATGRDFVVSVSIDEDWARIVVTDAGAGFTTPARLAMPAADAPRRRGLVLMHALVDRVHITSTPAGTIVALAARLTTPPATRRRRDKHTTAVTA